MVQDPCSLTVGADEAGLPMDRLLMRHLPGMSRAKVRLMLESGRLRLNGSRPERPGIHLQAGDRIAIEGLPSAPENNLQILQEDPAFVVLLKTAGRPLPSRLSLPGRHSPGRPRPGKAWRILLPLDPRISGVTLAASNPSLARQLERQFAGGGAGRRFLAVVRGGPGRTSGPLTAAPGWSYKRVSRYLDATLLRLVPPPDSGADPLAALAAAGLAPLPLDGQPTRLALHATGLFFQHPRSGRSLHFDPVPPAPFQRLLETLPPVPTLAADLPPAPPRGPVAAVKPTAGPEPALRSPREILQRAARREHQR